MERKMIEELREVAGVAGPAAKLANEMLVFHDEYTSGHLTKEEYEFLLREIADIRAQQELASDEIAFRWVVAAAQGLLSIA
jgi:hypothetical protein